MRLHLLLRKAIELRCNLVAFECWLGLLRLFVKIDEAP